MKKRSTFLFVMSIIAVIFGAITLLSSIAGIAMKDTLEATYAAMGMASPGILLYVFSFIGSVLMVAAGIVGITYKSKKLVLIFAVLITLYYLGNMIYTIVTTGFTALTLTDLIFPLLYFWGWYQSN